MQQSQLEAFIDEVKDFYEIVIIGKSALGRDIYAVNYISAPSAKWALVTGGMHAREHLSCDLICMFMKEAYKHKLDFNISFVPLVNPDGVELCVNGCGNLSDNDKERLIKINQSEDFSLFKANANGVDLNNNWDADWHNKFSNKTVPSSQGFYGYKAMSEPEVQALAEWSKNLDLFISISFHLKGEEVYYDFHQTGLRRRRDRKIAKVFARSSGYHIRSTQKISSGGFKDWCVKKLKIPALTIELGDDKFPHPFPKSELKYIYYKNQDFFKNLSKCLKIAEKYQKNIKNDEKS